jgi:hypothetical protein
MNSKQIAKQHGRLSEGEVDLIHKCANLLPDNPIIVNIGAGMGTRTLAFFEARSNAYILEIDIVERPLAIEHTKHYSQQIARIRGHSQNIGINWPYLVDCVFVDGDHGDKAVEGDIKTWLPKIKSSGIILFHDYKHRNVPGLTVIVDKYMKGYKCLGEERYLIAYEV